MIEMPDTDTRWFSVSQKELQIVYNVANVKKNIHNRPLYKKNWNMQRIYLLK